MAIHTYLLKTASIAAVAAIALGTSTSAFAMGGAQRFPTFRVTGTIVSVNRDARTLVVRDASATERTVHVAEGANIRLSAVGNPAGMPADIAFENALRGLHVNVVGTPTEAAPVSNGDSK